MVWLRIRRWVVRPFFWTLAAVAFVVLCLRGFLSSDFVREHLASQLEQQLSQILHRTVLIGKVDFELIPFALRIEDFSIAGPTAGAPLLLSVHRLRVDADLDALKDNVLDLQTVSAQGVRVHIELYADGQDNLPKFASAGGGSRFTLRVGGLFVEDGEFELADQRMPLEISARALLLRLSGIGGTQLQGTVTAQEIVTTLPKALPWASTLTAKARLRDDRVEILRARVRAPDFDARVAGFVGWRGGANGEIHGVVDTEGRFLDDLGYLSGEIDGPLRFEGGVRFVHRELELDGRLTSPAVDLFGFHLDDLAGRVASGGSHVSSLGLDLERANFSGGPVTGRFEVDFDHPGPLARLNLRAEGPHLQEVLANLHLPAPAFSAAVFGDVHYEFPLNDARRGAGSAVLELRALPVGPGGAVPIAGTAVLNLVEGRLGLQDIELASSAQRLSLRGNYDLVGELGELVVEVSSRDLAELARVQPFVENTPAPLWLPDSGHGRLTARVALGGAGTAVDLDLDLMDVHAPGGSAEHARGSLRIDPTAVRDLAIELQRGSATLRLTGLLPLSATPSAADSAATPQVALEVDFHSWPATEAMPWLPAPLPLAGEATGRLHLAGTIAEMTGELRGVVAPVTIAGIDCDRLTVGLDWDPDRLRVEELRLEAPTGLLQASGELRFAGDELHFDLAAERLNLDAEPWRALSGARLSGSATLSAQLTGTLEAPRLVLDADLADLEIPGARGASGADSTASAGGASAAAATCPRSRAGRRRRSDAAAPGRRAACRACRS